ncbi:ORF6N domain-containing protein [Sphingobacterium sp. MYb382]|uniref:ORF6N domain-containing protein n=1 Tax=Sphingobacterium sp. MYb382 TaxID=2745278 RepID=UPI0030B24FC5
MNTTIINRKEIECLIYTVRDKQVVIDRDLASLYQVETKILNKAVKRNTEQFPDSFCFQLAEKESETLRFQIGTSNTGCGRRRHLTYVFTEQGIAMLSAVLRSEVAVKVSIEIMNAFVEMRKILIGNAALLSRVDKIELKQVEADGKFEEIFRTLDSGKLQSEKGIFYDGQIFDAFTFISNFIRGL